MSDYSSFKDFKVGPFNYLKITKMPFVEVEGCDYHTRIYYEKDSAGDGCGFEALILSCILTCVPEDKYTRHPPFSKNDAIMIRGHILAAFDGIRHFFVEYDHAYKDCGYIFYPNLNEWIAILHALRQLEKELCREPHSPD